MKLPDWTKPALWALGIGAVGGMAAMPYVFGYMGPTAAERIAKDRAETAVVAVMATYCAEKFAALPDYTAKRAELQGAPSYKRDEVIPKALVTFPGASYANSNLVAACAEAILKPTKAASVR